MEEASSLMVLAGVEGDGSGGNVSDGEWDGGS